MSWNDLRMNDYERNMLIQDIMTELGLNKVSNSYVGDLEHSSF